MRIITEYRKRHDLTRDQLGAIVGVTGESVRLWELGKRFPSPKLAIEIEQITAGELHRSDLRPDIWEPAHG